MVIIKVCTMAHRKGAHMKTNTKNAIAIIITIVAFAALVIVFSHTGKMKMNPDDAIGNTAGNLNNDGLFCEIGDKIYFSNLYDGGALFAVLVDLLIIDRHHKGRGAGCLVGDHADVHIGEAADHFHAFILQRLGERADA